MVRRIMDAHETSPLCADAVIGGSQRSRRQEIAGVSGPDGGRGALHWSPDQRCGAGERHRRNHQCGCSRAKEFAPRFRSHRTHRFRCLGSAHWQAIPLATLRSLRAVASALGAGIRLPIYLPHDCLVLGCRFRHVPRSALSQTGRMVEAGATCGGFHLRLWSRCDARALPRSRAAPVWRSRRFRLAQSMVPAGAPRGSRHDADRRHFVCPSARLAGRTPLVLASARCETTQPSRGEIIRTAHPALLAPRRRRGSSHKMIHIAAGATRNRSLRRCAFA